MIKSDETIANILPIAKATAKDLITSNPAKYKAKEAKNDTEQMSTILNNEFLKPNLNDKGILLPFAYSFLMFWKIII